MHCGFLLRPVTFGEEEINLKDLSFQAVTEDMKLPLRLALSVYAGFMLYTALVLLFGSAGVLSLQSLKNYEARLRGNIVDLQTIHTGLQNQRDSLLYDPQELELQARKLGYLPAGDMRIFTPGGIDSGRHLTLGRVMSIPTFRGAGYAFFRALGLAAAIGCFILLTVVGGRLRDHQ